MTWNGYAMGGDWGLGMLPFWGLVVVGIVLLVRWLPRPACCAWPDWGNKA